MASNGFHNGFTGAASEQGAFQQGALQQQHGGFQQGAPQQQHEGLQQGALQQQHEGLQQVANNNYTYFGTAGQQGQAAPGQNQDQQLLWQQQQMQALLNQQALQQAFLQHQPIQHEAFQPQGFVSQQYEGSVPQQHQGQGVYQQPEGSVPQQQCQAGAASQPEGSVPQQQHQAGSFQQPDGGGSQQVQGFVPQQSVGQPLLRNMKLEVPEFSGKQFSLWKARVRGVLGIYGLWEALEEQAAGRAVSDSQAQALAQFASVIALKLRGPAESLIKEHQTFGELWNELTRKFAPDTRTTRATALKKMVEERFISSGKSSVLGFFEQKERLAREELQNALSADELILTSVLCNLPSGFGPVVNSLLLEPNLTLETAKQRLAEQERAMRVQATEVDTQQTSAVLSTEVRKAMDKVAKKAVSQHWQTKGGGKGVKKGKDGSPNSGEDRRKCYNCGKRGHLSASCPEKSSNKKNE